MQTQEYATLRAVEDHHWWYGILHDLVNRELRGRLPAAAHVLDAGCGTGGTMSRLRQEHPEWLLEGIDLDGDAVHMTQARGLQNIRQGTLNELPYASATFDVILGLDVLYHQSVDEDRALDEMTRVLKPGGVLLLNLPAFESLRGSHDVAVCGARRYKACQVRDLLENRNLSIEMIHYWNAWLFLPLLFMRQWSRLGTGHHGASDLQMPPYWLNAALMAVGQADARICRVSGLPFGSSIFAVAIKPAN